MTKAKINASIAFRILGLLIIVFISGLFVACSKPNSDLPKNSESIVQPAKPNPSSRPLTKAELYAHIDVYLSARDFNGLEVLAEDLRKQDIHFAGGSSALFAFYARTKRFRPDSNQEKAQNSFSFVEKRQLLQDWLAAMPGSITARIALSQMYSFRAWEMRGEGYFNELTEEQIKGMRENNSLAFGYLEGLDKNADPHIYLMLMENTKLLISADSPSTLVRNKRATLDILFEQAVKKFPTYFHYYAWRAEALQGKWFGKPGELVAFAQQVYDTTAGDIKTLPAYAFLVCELFEVYRRDLLFSQIGLRWPQIRASFEAIEVTYGLDNYTWNLLLGLAVQAADLGVAKTAAIHIDGQRNANIYIQQSDFDADVAWANWQPEPEKH